MNIPSQYVTLCNQWHSGQSSMMYAVSSSGGLFTGTQRPHNDDEDRPMTDAEWERYLFECLEIEIRQCEKIATKMKDQLRLKKFLVWTVSQIQELSVL